MPVGLLTPFYGNLFSSNAPKMFPWTKGVPMPRGFLCLKTGKSYYTLRPCMLISRLTLLVYSCHMFLGWGGMQRHYLGAIVVVFRMFGHKQCVESALDFLQLVFLYIR